MDHSLHLIRKVPAWKAKLREMGTQQEKEGSFRKGLLKENISHQLDAISFMNHTHFYVNISQGSGNLHWEQWELQE